MTAGLLGIAGVLLGLFVGRRQVSDQAQVEHGQWLRGQRLQAYLDFLHSWGAAMSAMEDLQEERGAELDLAVENVGEVGLAERMQEVVVARANGPLAEAADAAERATLVATPPLEEQVEDVLQRLMVLSSGLHSRARYESANPEWAAWNRGALEAREARTVFFRQAKADLETVPKPGTSRRRRSR
ncbi:hypothetical protein [Streptomyces sp. BA2]|uniref:hypothetical protein n=1 Tax=Streptomyces sp. BA2 TaxID=436595 RepID=UPI0013269BF8|nr:hypothetical protein [Streptomyces sp. BA2]MWA08141.1 hypothetical protein [Streptomyces sp. BA2]